MSITSQTNGHRIIYINKEWIYEDSKEPISKTKPCKYCGKHSTKEGHDNLEFINVKEMKEYFMDDAK